MNEVILAGASSGGNLAGMLAVIATQKEIAQKLNTQQYLSKDHIKAVVLMSGLINNKDFSITHSIGFDWLFFQCARSVFHTDQPQKSEIAELTNLIDQVDEKFPACYISDGNVGTFYEQAQAFHDRLEALGVENTLNLYPVEEVKLPHGYEMYLYMPCAQDNLEKTILFLDHLH